MVRFISIILCGFAFGWPAVADKGASSPGLQLPFRAAFLAGYSQDAINFDADQEKTTLRSPDVGVELNIPIWRVMIGATTWFDTSHGNLRENGLFIGPYLGYIGDHFEVLGGVGWQQIDHTLVGAAALGNRSIDYLGNGNCQFGGFRYKFAAHFGAGVNLYQCRAETYQKTVTDNLNNETKTNPALMTSQGGFLFLYVFGGREGSW